MLSCKPGHLKARRGGAVITTLEQQVKTRIAQSKLECMIILVLSGSFLQSRSNFSIYIIFKSEKSERKLEKKNRKN